MSAFIHTISLKKHISLSDKTKLNEVFKDNIIWIDEEKNYIMQKYAGDGVTFKIAKNSDAEQKFNKAHHMFKIEIIVNLFKLLNPGKEYGMIVKRVELESGIKHLWGILKQIEQESAVCLYEDLILKRVDVAKDIITPSDEYTQEIIRLSKLSPKKYGYRNYIPDEKTRNKKWRIEDSSMFYSKYVNAKLYNKKQDLLNHNITPDSGDKGLLRFEVSLKTRALINLGFIESGMILLDDLAQTLYNVTCDGEYILSRFFKEVLADGSMLSKEIQNKYIKMKYDGKKTRIKNMKEYRNAVNMRMEYDFTSDKAYRIKEHFEAIRLSPLYSYLPYIPSFGDILDGKKDNGILNYAYFKSKDKNQIFW